MHHVAFSRVWRVPCTFFVLFFRKMFFYLVTTGWIEFLTSTYVRIPSTNAINQSIKVLTGFLPLSATASTYTVNRHHSRVYRVTEMRTDGVRCQESAGTGSVVLKLVLETDAAFSSVTMDLINVDMDMTVKGRKG